MQWAFGVVCWEVFKLGRNPYPGIDNSEISDYIGGGHRLKKPSLCPQNMYVLIDCNVAVSWSSLRCVS